MSLVGSEKYAGRKQTALLVKVLRDLVTAATNLCFAAVMRASPTIPELPFERKEEWTFWRGTPELLAQIARTALRCATQGDREANCVIDLEVAGDHEVFLSPRDFVTDVTREALRKFKSIQITAVSEVLAINVTLRWLRPWWALGRGADAEVILSVRSEDKLAVEDALVRVRAAIKRGGTDRRIPQGLVGFIIGAISSGLLAAGLISAFYLLKVSANVFAWVIVVPLLLGLAISFVWAAWSYPSLEVASSGQTNLLRLIKFVGPIMVALIVSGIAKALYG